MRVIDLVNARAIEIDGFSYALIAEHFGRGEFGEALRNVFPPFYPLVISIFHLVIPDVELAGRLVSLICGLLLICGFYVAAKKFIGSAKALWGAFFLAVHPYLIRYSAQVLSESLATLLFAATVFFFFVGYTDKRGGSILFSGFLLVLTYLTRPEYIVYYAPFAAFLLWQRRWSHVAPLFVPFVVLGAAYMGYMRLATGLWMVSGKVMHNPFASLPAAFMNVPFVIFHFFAALFPPFILLFIPGFRHVDRPYRNLIVVLAIFHVLSLACVSHSTRRYSVEFIPLLMVFVVEGWYGVKTYAGRFAHGRALWLSAVVLISFLALWQGIEGPHEGRSLFKKAGLLLLQRDRGANIASRLPLPSFYDKGPWTDVSSSCAQLPECPLLLRYLESRSVKYFVLDDNMVHECSWLEACLAGLPLIEEFSNREGFVRIYRVPPAASGQQ